MYSHLVDYFPEYEGKTDWQTYSSVAEPELVKILVILLYCCQFGEYQDEYKLTSNHRSEILLMKVLL